MIFVTVGTTEQPFDRLLKAVDGIARDEPLVVQYGHSTFIPRDCEAVQFLAFDAMKATIDRARIVLCHAGAGTLLNALCFGKRPIAAPRLQRFGEMVDDHQLDLLEAFVATGSVIPYMPGDDLAVKLREADGQGSPRVLQPAPELVAFMDAFLRGSTGR